MLNVLHRTRSYILQYYECDVHRCAIELCLMFQRTYANKHSGQTHRHDGQERKEQEKTRKTITKEIINEATQY